MDDPVDRDVCALVDNALDELCDKLDRLRDRRGLTDAYLLARLEGWPDLVEAYQDWINPPTREEER